MFLLTIASLGALLWSRQTALRRFSSEIVSAWRTTHYCAASRPKPGWKIARLVKPFENVVPRSKEDISTVQQRLGRAGYREKSYVNVFFGFKVLVPGVLCLLATVTGAYQFNAFFVFAMAGGLGFLLPDFWLSSRIRKRQLAIRLGLPEALDLIVICVEAGLSMDKATMRTGEELRLSQPAIADELNLVYLEQRAGRPRSEAWKHFGERTGVDTVRSLASILIQADKFGTGIGKTYTGTHSETLRTLPPTAVMQREKAAKLPP